jgi:hypothetical protein
VYSQVYGFGELLADNMKTGSFVLQMDAGDPEAIKRYSVTIKHSELRDTILSLIYIPQGTAYISGIKAVTGGTEIGSQLTAGKVRFHGTPENQTVTYVWMRADDVDGPYTVIEGASSSVYVLAEADSGKYIRAAAYADQVRVGGFAVPAKRLRKVVFQPAAGAAPAGGFFHFHDHQM